MAEIGKEIRRVAVHCGNLIRHGRFNPFPRNSRKSKPKILRTQPEYEIKSSLEFFSTHVATRIQRPFFVLQIGAFDGKFDDPIAHLIRKYDWAGMLVEPQPLAFEALQANYRDQTQLRFENVAIGEEEGSVILYTLSNAKSPLASFERRHILRHSQRAADIIEQEVQSTTLESLLKKHSIQNVDLLQIDAEGNDAAILHSINFSLFCPPIIRYEHANLLAKDRCKCIELLADHGYRILLEDSDTIAFRENQKAAA